MDYQPKSMASSTLAITDAQTIEIISEKVISHFSTSGDSAIGKRNSRLGFETRTEKTTLEQWKEVNKTFVLTRACKKVESLIKSKNLVVVTGESGSGKSAIIQHIALSYKSQGWTVKPEYEVIKLINAYSLKGVSQTKTLFVFNDPFGKSSLDEKAYSSWKKNEKHINLYRQNVKILLSCRGYILNDSRVEGLLRNEAYVVDLSKNDLQLSSDEKQSILKNYTFNDNSSEETFGLVFDFEAYVQFFYEVYTSGEEQLEKLQCFKEPLSIFEKEIRAFKTSCEMKYCALVLLVLFNNKLLLANILEDNESRKKYHYAMDLLNILKSTKPELFRDILKTMEGFFVKKINEFYQFYNDFVMEVTTYVFGTDHPREMIKYADIGFLRRRVKLKSFKVESEQYTIYLPDSLISDLGKRLFEDIFGERLLDVVLNPCLKNEKVAKTFMKELKGHPEKIKMLVQKKKIEIKSKDVWQKSTSLLLSKIVFLNLEDKISPLDAVIVLGHTDLALYCVKALQKTLSENESRFLFPVVCCNGSLDLFTVLKKDNVKDFLVEKWESFYPIHIVSAFHNYEILVELVNIGVDVNLQTCCKNKWSPLALAAWNDTEENENKHRYNTGQKRRDVTVQLLLESGADINLCVKNKMSPLYTACKNGHDSTVQILLNNKADINLCDENGASPLLITCKEGHDSTVQLLLSNGADVNLCDENGVSPLLVTCQEGHDSTVQLLLNNGADVDLCKTYVTSPLHVACREGHDSTVQLLLNNRADVNLCDENGVSSLLIACLEGHDSTVQLLLKNGAHVYLCTTYVTSPLHVACQEGHDSTVQLLLNNGADVNLCDENTFSSLLIACLEGHDSTVQLLLNNGADVNFCDETGFSPLLAACLEGHDSTVQLLLNSGADVNLCDKHGFSPLYVACQEGYDSTAQLVLNYGAEINSCERNGASPLLIACQCGNADTAKLLLSQGADFNLSTKHGFSPLYLALAFRLHETVKLLIEYGANTSIENGCGFKSVSFDSNDKDDKTLQFLIQEDNVINNIHDPDSYFSLFVFCQVEEILQIICNQYEF